MVAAGEGLSFVPALAAMRPGAAEGLAAYSQPGAGPVMRDVLLVMRRGHPRRAMIAELAEVFRALDLPLGRHQGSRPAVATGLGGPAG